MTCLRIGLTSLALLLTTLAQAQEPVFRNTVKGTPNLKSIDAMAFGPGVLLLADGPGAQVLAIKCPPVAAKKWKVTEIPNIKDKLAQGMGGAGPGVNILKMAVEPTSGRAFFAVRQLSNMNLRILTLDGEGSVGEFSLEQVEHARVGLPKGEKGPITRVTDIAWGSTAILVTGLSNEVQSAKAVTIPVPVAHDAQGTMITTNTFHVAHNRWELNAPVRAILPFEDNGKHYLVGAFTCTPVAKFPLEGLKPGATVDGISVFEIGPGNTPQDMFVYQKAGKSYLLMNSYRFHHMQNPVGPSPYWAVRIDASILAEKEKLNTKALRRVKGKASENTSEIAQIIPAYHGVMHMDRLDGTSALVIRTDDKNALHLAVLPLP